MDPATSRFDGRRPVELARFDNEFAAHAAVIRLDQAGIVADVADAHTGSMLPHIGAIGVRVLVAAEDLERARAVLDAPRAATAPETEDAPEDDGEEDGAAGTEGREAPRGPETPLARATRARNAAILSLAIPLLFVYAAVLLGTGPTSSAPEVRARRGAAWAWTLGVAAAQGAFAYLLWWH